MSLSHGFELLRDEQVEELNARARLYRHARTGAELLSVSADDENKCFGVAFRTPPDDSTGIAHILEHSVLCGSRKYPVKKPFVELLKSSVKTFLNAFTGPDRTIYPVASTNLRDFYNLVDVYLDAVFFPLISPETLKQEGWHYELEHADGPLSYKGVVFNEMKGAYSSPDSLLYRYAQQSLFPDTTYGVSSGGDPRHIPDLTYEKFKRFHETLYHPSNARIFFYGDDDPEERLRLLDAYLGQFEPIEPPSQIGLQAPFPAPRSHEFAYPAPAAEAGARKGLALISWVIGVETDLQRVLALDILSYILLGTPAAPLRKALVDSGLGEDVTGGYNDGMLQHTFAVGMKGIDPADIDRVEGLILGTLERLAAEGLDPEAVASALNSTEFSLRENNTGSFPRGLVLMIRSLGTWLYERDPLAPLRFEAPLAAIRAAVEAGEPIFEDLIRQTLLANPHRTRVLLRPDPEQAERDAAEERARLDAAAAGLSPAERAALVEETAALRRLQEAPDDPAALARIPTLTLADMERRGKDIPSEERLVGGAPLLYHDLFTNGIAYLDLAFDLRTVDPGLLPLVPLFARALTEMGTSREDFVRLVQRIGRDTGGVGAAAFTASHIVSGEPLGRLRVTGKATLAQAGALLAILRDILTDVRLDNRERFRQIVTRARAGRESALVPSGNAFARKRAAARLRPDDWADEQMSGVSSLFALRELERRIDADWPGVLADLERLRASLINRQALLANLTLDAAGAAELLPALDEFIAALPAAGYQPAAWTTLPTLPGEGLTIPAKVNYVARVANLHALGIRPGGHSSAVTRLLSTAYLWEKIRVQGGAYGAACSYDRASGLFAFSSYRDPNLLGTLDVYAAAGQFLREVELDRTTVERSIIGTIGDIDAYQLPDARGSTAMVRHLTGVSDGLRQELREQLLGAGPAEFRALAELLDAVRDHGSTAVIGSAEAIAAANAARPGLLEVVKVL